MTFHLSVRLEGRDFDSKSKEYTSFLSCSLSTYERSKSGHRNVIQAWEVNYAKKDERGQRGGSHGDGGCGMLLAGRCSLSENNIVSKARVVP